MALPPFKINLIFATCSDHSIHRARAHVTSALHIPAECRRYFGTTNPTTHRSILRMFKRFSCLTAAFFGSLSPTRYLLFTRISTSISDYTTVGSSDRVACATVWPHVPVYGTTACSRSAAFFSQNLFLVCLEHRSATLKIRNNIVLPYPR